MNITVIEVWHYTNILTQYYNYLNVCITQFCIIHFTTITVYTYIYIYLMIAVTYLYVIQCILDSRVTSHYVIEQSMISSSDLKKI